MHTTVTSWQVIIALRDERGSYNVSKEGLNNAAIIALRDERGSYNQRCGRYADGNIIALRDERGSYNNADPQPLHVRYYSTTR